MKEATPAVPATIPVMSPLPSLIEQHMQELQALCRQCGVRRLTLFGSAARGTFDPQHSDLDFLVEFQPSTPAKEGRAWIDLWKGMRRVFDRPVDLVDVSTIDDAELEQSIRHSMIELYDAA